MKPTLSSSFVSAFLVALFAVGCARSTVPSHVRARTAWQEHDPSGEWVLTEPRVEDPPRCTITRPEGRHQVFGARCGSRPAELLVEGDRVWMAEHGEGAAMLYVWRQTDDGLEAVYGFATMAAPLGYEDAWRKNGDGWNGVFRSMQHVGGGRSERRLIVRPHQSGAPGVHRLHWSSEDGSWHRGAGMVDGDVLAAVRLEGVLVSVSGWSTGPVTYTQTSIEVGRAVDWSLGSYRMEGDELVGELLTSRGARVAARWARVGSGAAAEGAPSDEAPSEEAPSEEAATSGDATESEVPVETSAQEAGSAAREATESVGMDASVGGNE